MTIAELYQILLRADCKMIGCTEKEIAKIEHSLNIVLPQAYKEFLAFMGKKAGQFLSGSSAFYNEISDMQDGAKELLVFNQFKELPDGAFVFFMHQGYQFAFFLLEESDDPQVYYYYEGRTQNDFERTGDSFTDFLKAHLKLSGIKNG